MLKWFFCFSLLFGNQLFAEEGLLPPPPPKPDYMKKKIAPPQPPGKASQSMVDTPTPSKHKFLVEDSNEEVIFQKEEMSAGDMAPSPETEEMIKEAENDLDLNPDMEDVENLEELDVASKDDVRNQFLEDVESENPLAAEEPEPEEVAEQLGEVENTLEDSEQELEAQFEPTGRRPSSQKKLKAGMYKFGSRCQMFAEPNDGSDQQGSIRKGRKLWVDPHNEKWMKVYKKAGAVYIPANCLRN
ncbi:MAG: hypothetical protein AAF203_01170 [Pseudomonadota bacterium]